MLRVGLFGAGHLGKIHLRLLKEIESIELLGFYDSDPAVGQKVAQDYGIARFDSPTALIEAVDAVDIVTPTLSHYSLAEQALKVGKHVFIEKPLTHTLDEAEALIELSRKMDRIVQVGHVERFNPAFLALDQMEFDPMFIEGHRLAIYNPRGTDVSVILDLMIHDLDIILSLIHSPVKHISAVGVAVISESTDIANVRIEFENGCVANLTASRISVKNMRRLRMFQKNTYLVVDFLKKKTEIIRIQDEQPGEDIMNMELDTGKETKFLVYDIPEIQEVNSIKMELQEFAHAILHGGPVRVPIEDGYAALKVAHEILQAIDEAYRKAGISI